MSSKTVELFEVGYVKKAHGIKGEVLVRFYEPEATYLQEDLLVQTSKTTLTVARLKQHKSDMIVLFNEVNDRNASELLKGEKLYINSDLAKDINSSGELFLGSIIGYNLKNYGEFMGVVQGLTKTKAHELVQLELADSTHTVELPWVDEFIVSVDHEKSTVFYEAPAELFDYEFFDGTSKK